MVARDWMLAGKCLGQGHNTVAGVTKCACRLIFQTWIPLKHFSQVSDCSFLSYIFF